MTAKHQAQCACRMEIALLGNSSAAASPEHALPCGYVPAPLRMYANQF